MLIGCLRISLSNFRSLMSFRKKMHIVKNKNGSVGKLILIGVLGINSDSSTDRGVKNIMRINNLSNAKKARRHNASTNGTNEMRYDSFQMPNILAMMKTIAAM